jgi:hypothetical protein
MWPFSEMSLSTASLVGTIANWALLISLLTGLFSTFVIVKTTDVKEEHWETARQQSGERLVVLATKSDEAKAALGAAQADIAKANAKIADAQTEAAKAVAETARANERTAELKLALEREIAARQPRLISPEAKAAIVAKLKNDSAPKGRAVVMWKQFDEEAEQFGKQTLEVLQASGFDAHRVDGPMGFSAKGAWILVRDFESASATPSALGALQAAFREVLNVELDGKPRPLGFPEEDVIIAIGPKP